MKYTAVKGYEGYYSISKNGEVISHYFNTPLKHNTSLDYPRVTLYKPGVRGKTYTIHRLLAEHFIENPDNLPLVNHINGITNDYRLSNLEWVTTSYNVKDGFNRGRKHPMAGRRIVDRNKICEMCELIFQYVKPKQRFCSKKCSGINNLRIIALADAGELNAKQ